MILRHKAEELAVIAQEIGAEVGYEMDTLISDVDEWLGEEGGLRGRHCGV